MASQFRRSRQKLSSHNHFIEQENGKENMNVNLQLLPGDLLEVRRKHNQQLRKNEYQNQCKLKQQQLVFQQEIERLKNMYESKLKEKQEYINLLENNIKNIESQSQQEIQELNKRLTTREETKKTVENSIRQSIAVCSLSSQRASIQKNRSRSIFVNKQSIESKHKAIPVRKPVYTKQMYMQRKLMNL